MWCGFCFRVWQKASDEYAAVRLRQAAWRAHSGRKLTFLWARAWGKTHSHRIAWRRSRHGGEKTAIGRMWRHEHPHTHYTHTHLTSKHKQCSVEVGWGCMLSVAVRFSTTASKKCVALLRAFCAFYWEFKLNAIHNSQTAMHHKKFIIYANWRLCQENNSWFLVSQNETSIAFFGGLWVKINFILCVGQRFNQRLKSSGTYWCTSLINYS